MKWLVLVGLTLFAANPATSAASHPLVHKDSRPAQFVSNANPIHWPNPARESDLFRRFVEWLKRQPR
jgi:hypothetical protein